jgi:hypothetical protein
MGGASSHDPKLGGSGEADVAVAIQRNVAQEVGEGGVTRYACGLLSFGRVAE